MAEGRRGAGTGAGREGGREGGRDTIPYHTTRYTLRCMFPYTILLLSYSVPYYCVRYALMTEERT